MSRVELDVGVADTGLPPVARQGRAGPPVVSNLSALRARLERTRAVHGWRDVASRRRLVVVSGFAAFALVILLLVLAVDAPAVGWANELTRAARRLVRVVTRLGRSDWLLIPSGVLVLVLLAGDWRRAGRRAAAAWTEVGSLAGFFFVAVALSGMTGNVLKVVLGRSRPVLLDSDGALALTPFSFHYASLSFPSGHAITAAAAATALALIYRGRPWVAVVAGGFALAIAASRVLVRAHYPTDIVAGLFIGFAVTFLLAQVFGRRGIAFRHDADGRLVPNTMAIRRVFGSRAGRREAFAGLRAAFLGPPRSAPSGAACGKASAEV